MTRFLNSQFSRLVAVSLAGLFMSATVAQADFRGGGVLFGFSDVCATHGWVVNGSVPVRTRYTPAEDVSAPPSQVTIAFPTGTEHISQWGNMVPSNSFLGVAGRQIWSRFSFYETRPLVRVVQRVITQRINAGQPESIQNAREIVLRLRIQNFNNLPGCTAVLAATMRRI